MSKDVFSGHLTCRLELGNEKGRGPTHGSRAGVGSPYTTVFQHDAPKGGPNIQNRNLALQIIMME